MFRSWYLGSSTPPDKQPVELFISYSHKDEELCDNLKVHLSNLRRQNVIDDWHDRKIVPGEEWAKYIYDHINSARVILRPIS